MIRFPVSAKLGHTLFGRIGALLGILCTLIVILCALLGTQMARIHHLHIGLAVLFIVTVPGQTPLHGTRLVDAELLLDGGVFGLLLARALVREVTSVTQNAFLVGFVFGHC